MIASYIYEIITFGLDMSVADIKPHPSIYVSYESEVYKVVKTCSQFGKDFP